MDAGLAAIIGAAVGSTGTIAIAFLDRLGRRRTEDREDHIRDLDRRRDLYAQCLELVWELHQFASDISLEVQIGAPVEASDLESLRDSRLRLGELVARIDLLSPASVRSAFGDLFREASIVGSAIDLRNDTFVSGVVADKIEQLRSTEDGGIGFLERFGELAEALTGAMRADLRIREPEATKAGRR